MALPRPQPNMRNVAITTPLPWADADVKRLTVSGLDATQSAYKKFGLKFEAGDLKAAKQTKVIAWSNRYRRSQSQSQSQAQPPSPNASDNDIMPAMDNPPANGGSATGPSANGAGLSDHISFDDFAMDEDALIAEMDREQNENGNNNENDINDLLEEFEDVSNDNREVDMAAVGQAAIDMSSDNEEHEKEEKHNKLDDMETQVKAWCDKHGFSMEDVGEIWMSLGFTDFKYIMRMTTEQLEAKCFLSFGMALEIRSHFDDEQKQQMQSKSENDNKGRYSPNRNGNGHGLSGKKRRRGKGNVRGKSEDGWIADNKYTGPLRSQWKAECWKAVHWACSRVVKEEGFGKDISVKLFVRAVGNATRSGNAGKVRHKYNPDKDEWPNNQTKMAMRWVYGARKANFCSLSSESYKEKSHGGRQNWSGFARFKKYSRAFVSGTVDQKGSLKQWIRRNPGFDFVGWAVGTNDERDMRIVGLIGGLNCSCLLSYSDAVAANGAGADAAIAKRMREML